MINHPEADKPPALSGAADVWDTPAGGLLLDEFFTPVAAPTVYTLACATSVVSCSYSAQGGGYTAQALTPGTTGEGTFGYCAAVSEDGSTRVVSWGGTSSGDTLEVFRLSGDGYVYDHSISTSALGASVYFTTIAVSSSGRYVAIAYAPTDDSASGVAILEHTGPAWSVVYSDAGQDFNYAVLKFSRDESLLVYSGNAIAPRVAALDGTWSLVQTLAGDPPDGCEYQAFVANPSLSMLVMGYAWQEDAQTVPLHLYVRSGSVFTLISALTPGAAQAYNPLAVSDNGRIFCAVGEHVGDGDDDTGFVVLERIGGVWAESVVPHPSSGIYRDYLDETYYPPALDADDNTLVLSGYALSDDGVLSTIYRRGPSGFTEVANTLSEGWSLSTTVSVDGRTVFVCTHDETGASGGTGVTRIFEASADWEEVEAVSAVGMASPSANLPTFVSRSSAFAVLNGVQTVHRSALQMAVTRPTVTTMGAEVATVAIGGIDATLRFLPIISMFATGYFLPVQASSTSLHVIKAIVAESAAIPIMSTETAPRTFHMSVEPASIGLSRYGVMTQTDSLSLPFNNNGNFMRVLAISGDGNTLAYGYYPNATIGSAGKIDVYIRAGAAWEFQASLIPDDLAIGGSVIGYVRKYACGVSLSEDGNTLVSVGDIVSVGVSLCVFKRDEGVWSYAQAVPVDSEARRAIISADGSTVLVDQDGLYFDLVRRVDGQYARMAGSTEFGYTGNAISADGSRTVYLSSNDNVYRVFNTRTMEDEATLQDAVYSSSRYAAISGDGTHAAIGVRYDMAGVVELWHRVDDVWSMYATIDPPGAVSPSACYLADDARTLIVRQAATGATALHKYRREGNVWTLIGSTSYADAWLAVTASSRGGRVVAINEADPASAITFEESAPSLGLHVGRASAVEALSVSVAGSPLALRLVRALIAQPAAQAISTPAAYSVRVMPANAVSLSVVGVAVGLEAAGAKQIGATAASLPLTSTAAALLKSIPPLAAQNEVVPLAAYDPWLTARRKSGAEVGSVTVSGEALPFVLNKPFFAGSFSVVGRTANLIGPVRRLLAETGVPLAVTTFAATLGPLARMPAPKASVPVSASPARFGYQQIRHLRVGVACAVFTLAAPGCRLAASEARRLMATAQTLPIAAGECHGRRSMPASRGDLAVTGGALYSSRAFRLAAAAGPVAARYPDALLYLRRSHRAACDSSVYAVAPSRRMDVTTRSINWWIRP